MIGRDYKKICMDITGVTKSVRSFILNERLGFQSSSVMRKGHNDLVSYVDRNAEEKIVEQLKKIIPGSGFITEEKTVEEAGNEFTWIIDPLDGTTNFIHGMPCFCISIGLLHDKKLVAGVVHELNFDECFYAWKNGGAYLNAQPIRVSETPVLSDSLMATGFPYHNYERMKPYMEIFDHCMHHTHGLRRLGSAAADLAYVACGRFDGFYEYGLNSWDVAGGAFIVQEAGGTVTDFTGGDNFIFGSEIVATNNRIAWEFMKVVKEKFANG